MAMERELDPKEPRAETRTSWADQGLDILVVGPQPKRQLWDLVGRGQYDRAGDLRADFFEKRNILRAIRAQIPEMEATLERAIANGAQADDIRSMRHNLDLKRFDLRKLEPDVLGLQRNLAELGEEHTVD